LLLLVTLTDVEWNTQALKELQARRILLVSDEPIPQQLLEILKCAVDDSGVVVIGSLLVVVISDCNALLRWVVIAPQEPQETRALAHTPNPFSERYLCCFSNRNRKSLAGSYYGYTS